MIEIGKINQILKDDFLYKTLMETERPGMFGKTQSNMAKFDNLSQLVVKENAVQLQTYTQKLYETTVEYFTTNLLSINTTKTEILTFLKNKDKDLEIFIMTSEGKIIKNCQKVKVLGITHNSRNSIESHVSMVAFTIGLIYKQLKPLIMNAETSHTYASQ